MQPHGLILAGASLAVMVAGTMPQPAHWSLPEASLANAVDPLKAAPMGCRVTVKASNSGKSDIWIRSEDSRVRAYIKIGPTSTWGTWKQFPMSNRRVRPGESITMAAELELGCDFKRQYEFALKRGVESQWKKIGGSDGTTTSTLVLGDLYQLFK